MSFQEIERGVGRWLLDMAPSVRSKSSEVIEGSARLRFPDGHSFSVTAELSLSRSFFAVAGEGCFWSDEPGVFDSVNICEPLELVFNTSETVWIEVRDARIGPAGCRCSFAVHS